MLYNVKLYSSTDYKAAIISYENIRVLIEICINELKKDSLWRHYFEYLGYFHWKQELWIFPAAWNPNLSLGLPAEFSSDHSFYGNANLSTQPIILFPVDKLMKYIQLYFHFSV